MAFKIYLFVLVIGYSDCLRQRLSFQDTDNNYHEVYAKSLPDMLEANDKTSTERRKAFGNVGFRTELNNSLFTPEDQAHVHKPANKARKLKKHKTFKKQKVRQGKGEATTPYMRHALLSTIDDKFYYEDPILNIYNSGGRRKIKIKLSGNIDELAIPRVIYNIESSAEEDDFGPADEKSSNTANEQNRRCSYRPRGFCVESYLCKEKDRLHKADHLCNRDINTMVCCEEPIIKNPLKCSSGICVASGECPLKKRLQNYDTICRKLSKDEVHCCNPVKIYLAGILQIQFGSHDVCSDKPRSICVPSGKCSAKNIQTKNHPICEKSKLTNEETVCCTADQFENNCVQSPGQRLFYCADGVFVHEANGKITFYKSSKTDMIYSSGRNENTIPELDESEKCSDQPTSYCKASCNLDYVQPLGLHYCINRNKVCCAHKTMPMGLQSMWSGFYKGNTCSLVPKSSCVKPSACPKKYVQPQGNHFCQRGGSSWVCCPNHITGQLGNRCIQNNLAICVPSDSCDNEAIQNEGNDFCSEAQSEMVCCKQKEALDTAELDIQSNKKKWVTCSQTPPSVCVHGRACPKKYLQPQGHHFCEKIDLTQVCCSNRVFGQKHGKICSNNPPAVCVWKDDCNKKDIQKQGNEICSGKKSKMVCCKKKDQLDMASAETISAPQKSKWGIECLAKPFSICVLPRECTKKYEYSVGDKVCQGGEKMICCNFYNYENLGHLIDGNMPDEQPPKKTTVVIQNLGEWGARCSHKPKSICVASHQCTEKFYSPQGHHFCSKGKLICCDIYNYLWEMLFDHGKINEGSNKEKQIGKWGDVCSNKPDAICVLKSECTSNYQVSKGDRRCGAMVCCEFYKQLWNLLVENKLPESDSEEVTTVKTTATTGRKSQWGVRCNNKPDSICVLKEQCAEKFQTPDVQKTCNKGPERMICCDFLKHVWNIFVEHSKVTVNNQNIDKKKKKKQLLEHKPADIERESKHSNKKHSKKYKNRQNRKFIEHDKIRTSKIKLNGFYVDVHEIRVDNLEHKRDGRRQSPSRDIYLPNGELLWRIRALGADEDNNNIINTVYNLIRSALDDILNLSNVSDTTTGFKQKKKNSEDASDSSDVNYDSEGIYSEDLFDEDLNLSGFDTQYGNLERRWGKLCSHTPKSVCVFKKQCKKKFHSPQGHHFCKKTSKTMVCCDINYIWKHPVSGGLSSGTDLSILPNEDKSIWGIRCCLLPESTCVFKNQCVPQYEVPEGNHICQKNKQLVCCDYITYLWTHLIEKGKYTTKSPIHVPETQYKDAWGIRCSNRPASICVLKTQCSKKFHSKQGHHFCAKGKNMVCCDFISYLYYTLIIKGKWPNEKYRSLVTFA